MFTRCAAAVAVLVVAVSACGSPSPPRADHGSYATTGAAQEPVRRFVFPRAKRLLITSPSARFPCARAWAERDLQGKGITLDTAPAGSEGALVLSIAIDSVEGPGGSWNAWSGAITSSHQRTDISLAITEPGSAAALWRSQTRLRTNLGCADQALRTQLQLLLDNIG
jgi:hypothetical protein